MSNAKQDLRRFLERLSPHVHLVAILPDAGKIEGRYFGADVGAAVEWSATKNRAGSNIHYTVNVPRAGLDRKPRKYEIQAVRFAHVDIDPPRSGSDWCVEDVMISLAMTSPGPSIIVQSGNGVQALWPVEGASVAEIERVNRGLIEVLGGDPGTYNADRLLRVPGTTNYPDAKKKAAGRGVTRAKLVTDSMVSDFPSDIEDLVSAFGSSVSEGGTREDDIKMGAYELETADTLALAPRDPVRKLIDDPKGVDRSADTYALCCELLRREVSPEQVVGLLLNPANPVSAHCIDQPDPVRAAKRATSKALQEVRRRQAQRAKNRQIGEGQHPVPTTDVLDLDAILERYVFVKEGSLVSDLKAPQLVQSLSDFRNTKAASKHELSQPDGRRKLIPCSKAWLEHPERKEVDTITFHAGGLPITTAPQSCGTALNTWSPRKRRQAPSDWMGRAFLFVDHIEWLWGEHASDFLDFLAHIEQKPGELPHFGWIHVSRIHGKGRNWISSVIARIWAGNVASSLDLISIFEDGFNGRLSRCVVGIVDEINEGGNQSYRHAQALKKLVSEEYREINPKYGRRHIEYNSARWIFFSNHLGAIPLGEEDRRFYVVEHDGPARRPEYYEQLYGCLDDPLFIRSVAELLRQRDISRFKPGKRPPMTSAKSDLIRFSCTEDDEKFQDLARYWPVEVISASELRNLFDHEVLKRPSTKHAMDRAGIRRLKKVRLNSDTTENVYSLCHHAHWAASSPEVVRFELNSVSSKHKAELWKQGEAADRARL